MADDRHKIYIGTIALEANRWNWQDGRRPTYRVSDFLSRFAEAGFDGMELWENHAALVDEAELTRLADSPLPTAVFNTYAPFDDDGAADRGRAVRLAHRLRARGVKINVGKAPARLATYLRSAADWAETLGPGVRLLCECHSGSVLERPQQATEAFNRWEAERFQAVVHPFHTAAAELQTWFETLGPRITHAHVQLRGADGGLLRLERDPKGVRDTLRLMRDAGFAGSFTIEFTEGTGSPDENPETMLRNAAADLRFLRENLA